MGTHHFAVSESDASDWLQAHAALSRLARERAAFDAEEGRWLLCAWRAAAHVHLGYGSFAQYIERLFGYKPRTTQEKLRVAEALETLPRLATALETGALGWCAARELTRVALPETESAWLDAARGKTLRELEALVASRAPGDTPDTAALAPPRRRVLRFEVAADTFATFREAMQRLRRCAGGSLDDDALLLAMARHILGGPRDEGRSSYQVALSVCSACGGGEQQRTASACRSTQRSLPWPRATRSTSASSSPAPLSRQQMRMPASLLSRTAQTTPTWARRAPARAAPSPPPSKLPTPCRSDTPERHAGAKLEPSRRAKQTIPPALRRAVLTRDRRRCRVAGCTHATFVDVHHVRPRAEGGRNEASNLMTLCSAHHRAVHRGELLIDPAHDGAVTFARADGATYDNPIAPRLIDAHAKVFSALRHLAFRESEAKIVLCELRKNPELAGASVEHLLREELCRIKLAAR